MSCTCTFDLKKNSVPLFSVFSAAKDSSVTLTLQDMLSASSLKDQEYRCPFYSIYLYDYQHKNKM